MGTITHRARRITAVEVTVVIMPQPVLTALTGVDLGSEVLAQCLQSVDDPLRPRLLAILSTALAYGAEKAQAFAEEEGAASPPPAAAIAVAQQGLVLGGAAISVLLLLIDADRALARTAWWPQFRPQLVAQWTDLCAAAAPPAAAAGLVRAMTVPPEELPYLQGVCRHYHAGADGPCALAGWGAPPAVTLH